MWLSFWKPRNRFSLDELKYLTDQLIKIQVVNEVNKEFVVEALRTIAELIIYGDQHDSAFFEYFMEKQVMGEFVRLLKISRTITVSLQLLQTVSIMIQNLKSEHAIYYLYSNEHINYLITYAFDFRNEELLSYFISFLRAISGKLNQNTISLLVKTRDDEVVDFPLYVEAIRFAFQEESMIRTAIRALTLNVYHVGDGSVNKYVSSPPHSDYFLKLVNFFCDQCVSLNALVLTASKNETSVSMSTISSAVDEIEDNLYYFSDVISAGIPDVGWLITDSVLKQLIIPLLLPSLRRRAGDAMKIGPVTSLYLLCCILRIVKIKDLANTVAAAFLCSEDVFVPSCEAKVNDYICTNGNSYENKDLNKFNTNPEVLQGGNSCENQDPDNANISPGYIPSNGNSCENQDLDNANISPEVLQGGNSCENPDPDNANISPGYIPSNGNSCENQDLDNANISPEVLQGSLRVSIPNSSKSFGTRSREDFYQVSVNSSNFALRDSLLSYITTGDDVEVLGSLSMLATLLQTKELNESMLDALGILPQRKQHKKILLQALMGEGSGEEQLFSSIQGSTKDEISGELHTYMKNLQEQYGLSCPCLEVGVSPRAHRSQVLDSLVSLFCRSNISAETLWDGGWLLRQLLPYSEAEFKRHHLKSFKESFRYWSSSLLAEARRSWSDLLIKVLCNEWRKCKRVLEASSPRKDPKCLLLSAQKSPFPEVTPGESSFAAAERLCELVKVFVLLHQLLTFSSGGVLPELPTIDSSIIVHENSRARIAGVDNFGPKQGTEIKTVNSVPCRISFERGKERQFCFLAMSIGTSGWIVLAEEIPSKQHYGIARVVAPLAGCNLRIDDKHPRWLHLRIRPSAFPFTDTSKYTVVQGKLKTNNMVDGRWTLAFKDEDSCKSALSMITQEKNIQSSEVERRLEPLIELGMTVDLSNLTNSRTRLSVSA